VRVCVRVRIARGLRLWCLASERPCRRSIRRSFRSCVSACGCSSSVSTRSGGTFDVPALERQATELSERASAPDFWNDAERAQAVSRETSQVLAVVSRWKRRREAVDELEVLL